jgi:hypothetical protein
MSNDTKDTSSSSEGTAPATTTTKPTLPATPAPTDAKQSRREVPMPLPAQEHWDSNDD